MNKNEFISALAEKFPFMEMEQEVNGEIFADVFFKAADIKQQGLIQFGHFPVISNEEISDFFSQLEKVLDAHAQESSLRCVDILCFVGLNAAHRPKDLTLSYLRSKTIAQLVTKYLQIAIDKGNHMTLKHCLLLANLAFEWRDREAANLINEHLLPKIVPENVYVLDHEHEMALLESYHYVWDRNQDMLAIATRFVI